MDIHSMLAAISESGRQTRSNYHVCLGDLVKCLRDNPDAMVVVDETKGLGREDSYRGYYDDLSFSPKGAPTPAKEVLAACERALTETYEGYKGGTYRYDESTPLWVAAYGCCGSAIVDMRVFDGDIHLATKADQ